jgi:hypothetical protein
MVMALAGRREGTLTYRPEGGAFAPRAPTPFFRAAVRAPRRGLGRRGHGEKVDTACRTARFCATLGA